MVISTQSPHEVLRLINEVGIDLFDVSGWSSACARRGIGSTSFFLRPKMTRRNPPTIGVNAPRSDGRLDIGHNFFSHVTLTTSADRSQLLDGQSGAAKRAALYSNVCPCIACSPQSTATAGASCDPPHTRAYIHHLLHTHEMSAYALLESHNAAVIASFFSGIRRTLSTSLASNRADSGRRSQNGFFSKEITNFIAYYGLPCSILEEATREWEAVEKSRGKGSLKRARDAETTAKGNDDEQIHASVALGGTPTLGELVEQVELDAPAVLMLDPAPNVDIDTDVI